MQKVLSVEDKMNEEHIAYLLSGTKNKMDFLLLNQLEYKLMEIYGKDIYKESETKIRYISGYLITKDNQGLYKFYSGCFEQYMKGCNRDVSNAAGFNILFAVLVHVAYKVLRNISI